MTMQEKGESSCGQAFSSPLIQSVVRRMDSAHQHAIDMVDLHLFNARGDMLPLGGRPALTPRVQVSLHCWLNHLHGSAIER